MICRCLKCKKPCECGAELCSSCEIDYYHWLARTATDHNMMAMGRFYGESLLQEIKDGRTDNRMA